MAKKTSFTDMTATELTKVLGERREELRKLRFTAAGARTKDTNESGKIRKDIARILTALPVAKTK
jgi:ribosomal protein L29